MRGQNRRGPAWCNSLFEDASFGLGFRVSIGKQKEFATELVRNSRRNGDTTSRPTSANANQSDEAGIYDQRRARGRIERKIQKLDSPETKLLLGLADQLVRKSVWIVVVMAGPTTSVTAASTTCWPATGM